MKKFFEYVLMPGLALGAGFGIGYQTPRDVELESTKPVYFLLNADVQAAKLLVDQCEPVKEDAE